MGRTIEETFPVALSSTLKLTLKRGALVAAANWPLTIIQAVADSLFKLLVAAPLFGGIFLVALVVGAEPGTLLSLEWRDLATTIAASLLSKPTVLLAWVAALAVVIGGGSLFVFLIKGGAVSILVRGERDAGAIEHPPLLPDVVAQASAYSMDSFIDGANRLFPAYARLGLTLLAIYLASGAGFLALVAAISNSGEGWGLTALVTAAFVAWITLINFLYVLTQIVIAADGCSVSAAIPRALAFIRREHRTVGSVFLVVLGLVIFATGASVLATTALGLIAFVPLFGFIFIPLSLLAWMLRAVVFQYIGLSSIGAYLKLYREANTGFAERRVHGYDRLREVPVSNGTSTH
jgi:hypothetical protein